MEQTDNFFPNLDETPKGKRGLGAKPLLESQIKAAQEKSRSAFFLRCIYRDWETDRKSVV